MFALLLACSSPPPAPPPTAPAVEQTAPVQEQRYVHASMLNLRDAEGTKIGSLAINTPLVLQGEKDDKVQVQVANGTVGWVPKEFLGASPLSAEAALANAEATTDLGERIAHLQRAAALLPDVTTLTALTEAYEEAGESRKATVVRSQMGWPQHIRPVNASTEDGALLVEWPAGWEPGSAERVRRQMKLKVGDKVWVLPSYGSAVQGTVAKIELRQTNECSGEEGWVAVIQASLPRHATGVLISTQDAPQSWLAERPAPAAPYEEAYALVWAHLQSVDPEVDARWVSLRPQEGAWRSDYWQQLTEEKPEWGESWNGFHRHHIVEVNASGELVVRASEVHNNDMDELEVQASGDLGGTGVPVKVQRDSCLTQVTTLEGYGLLSSTYRCCGC